MIDIFHYAFFWKSFWSALLIGIMGGFIGTFIYLRGMVFIGAGIAHAAFAGVALALLLGLPPFPLAILFSLSLSAFIGIKEEDYRLSADTPVGILFTLTMAFALIIIGMMREYRSDIMSYMFGNVLTIRNIDIALVLISSFLILLFFAFYYRYIVYAIFDPDSAKIDEIKVKGILIALNIVLALFITVSLKSVGVILILSLLIIPPAAAYYLTHYMGRMILYSAIIGGLSSVGGMFVSVWLNLPSGPSIVILSGVLFFISYLFNPKRYECPVFEEQKRKRLYDIYKK